MSLLLTFFVNCDIMFIMNEYSGLKERKELRDREKMMIVADGKRSALDPDRILYVTMFGNYAEIHARDGEVFRVRMTLGELESELGDQFIKIHRGCIVSAEDIYNVADRVYLGNGEALDYTKRKKKEITDGLKERQKRLIDSLTDDGRKMIAAGYREFYNSFEKLPFAFADLEIVFDDERRAVDWIFRYGNQAFARLEKKTLDEVIGIRFSLLFDNSDMKWLRCCERAALHGETLEMMDYSVEIGAHIKVICFQTFRGHCGCFLFNLDEISFIETSESSRSTIGKYFDRRIGRDWCFN